jgi:hypothetical protein
MSKLIRLLVVAGVIFCLPGTVQAQQTGELSFVYGTNHFDGAVYSSTFIPPTVDTVYLLADHTSILASRLTNVYYWPITNEYKADWDVANVMVEGSLEILKGNFVVETIPMTEYVIQYDGLDQIGTTHLYLGDKAVTARTDFENLQTQYREDLYQYYEDLNNYREAFQAALADLQAGIITEDQLPAMPEPLADLTLFSTNLLWGFPVDMPAGTYKIQLRTDEGELLPESIKDLVVFEPLNEGIGYELFSEERWSDSEPSQDFHSVIYTLKNQSFFVEPYYQKQYNQLKYTRMNNPQDNLARSDRTIWVSLRPAEDVTLNIQNSSGNQTVELESYFVQQIAGSRLGYEIVPFDPESMNQASFMAFRVDLQNVPGSTAIQLLDQNGNIIQGSYRQVHVLRTQNTSWVYLFAVVPLALGLFALYRRKRKVQDVKVVGVG